MEILGGIVLIIYLIASYKSWNYLFEGTAFFGSLDYILAIKIIVPIAFGFILIPIALIKYLFRRFF